jgi:hypothetical protein
MAPVASDGDGGTPDDDVAAATSDGEDVAAAAPDEDVAAATSDGERVPAGRSDCERAAAGEGSSGPATATRPTALPMSPRI